MKNFSLKISLLRPNKELIIFLILFIFSYFLFFKNILNPKFNFWNSDAEIKMYPSQAFLNEKLRNFEFPLWTERVFLGYPIYEDMEIGYLNPVNLLGNFLLGELNNLKFLHFFSYFLGALCFYFLLSRAENSGLKVFGSVLIFFFSFFPINRLIHLNLILTYLTIPLVLFLSYKFNETNRLRFLILLGASLSYGILWGHIQTVILIFIILFLFNLNEVGFKKAIVYSIFSGILSVSFSLHQLYPSFQAFLQSSRISTDIKYSDFSNFPGFELTSIFPYLLGYYQNYQAPEFSGAMSYVETYNYIGIVAFVLLIFYLIYGSSDASYKFVRNLIIVYLILTFKDFFPIIKDMDIPIYDNFRYWNRSIILVIVAVVFGLNYLFSKNFSFSKSNFKFLFFISLFYVIMYFLGFFTSFNKSMIDFWNFLLTNNFIYLRKVEILLWIFLIFLSLIFLFFRKASRTHLFLIFFITAIFFDYFYFSLDLIPNRISRFNSFRSTTTPDVCILKRCYLENNSISGYEFLMYKTFGPYGYSQFVSQNYKDFYSTNFKGDYRKSYRSENLRSDLDSLNLENLGFSYILLANGNLIKLKNSASFLNSEIKHTFVSEDRHIFEVVSNEPNYLYLNLKYSPNWEVVINGSIVPIEQNGLFSKILVNKGLNYVELRYFPSDVLFGFLVGLGLFFSVTGVFYFLKSFAKSKFF